VPHCELVVIVLAVDGKMVRLGFSAPAEVEVYREEVWQDLGQDKRSPASERVSDAGAERDYRAGKPSWLAVTGSRSPPFWETAGSGAILQRSDPS
jgi:carbon storage regulator CsrA